MCVGRRSHLFTSAFKIDGVERTCRTKVQTFTVMEIQETHPQEYRSTSNVRPAHNFRSPQHQCLLKWKGKDRNASRRWRMQQIEAISEGECKAAGFPEEGRKEMVHSDR